VLRTHLQGVARIPDREFAQLKRSIAELGASKRALATFKSAHNLILSLSWASMTTLAGQAPGMGNTLACKDSLCPDRIGDD